MKQINKNIKRKKNRKNLGVLTSVKVRYGKIVYI